MRLTKTQRWILLAALEFEEEMRRDPRLFNLVRGRFTAKMIAWRLMTKGAREDGVETDSAEEWLAQMVASGAETVEGAYRKLRKRVEKVKRCLRQMAERRLVLPEALMGKRGPVTAYTLSPIGRSIARAIRYEEMGEEEGRRLLGEALRRLREKGPHATLDEVYAELQRVSLDLYGVDERTVEKRWSRRTLGKELREMGCRLIRTRGGGGAKWVYDLQPRGNPPDAEDLKRALESLNAPTLTMTSIREALWNTCGHRFSTREAFEREWSERKIGKLLRQLGAERRQKWLRGQNTRIWIYDISKIFPEKWGKPGTEASPAGEPAPHNAPQTEKLNPQFFPSSPDVP